jgi:hypothetical protein
VICHGYLRFEGEIRFQFQNLQYGMAIWAVSRDMKNLCYDENICNVELSGFQTASRFEIRLNDLLAVTTGFFSKSR